MSVLMRELKSNSVVVYVVESPKSGSLYNLFPVAEAIALRIAGAIQNIGVSPAPAD
jgi:hypothetical protein